jgi:hypothetical protein
MEASYPPGSIVCELRSRVSAAADVIFSIELFTIAATMMLRVPGIG